MTPCPKGVIAVGDCAVSGGEFGTSYASCGTVDQVIPVDVTIKGCPPTPSVLLSGILQFISQYSDKLAFFCFYYILS